MQLPTGSLNAQAPCLFSVPNCHAELRSNEKRINSVECSKPTQNIDKGWVLQMYCNGYEPILSVCLMNFMFDGAIFSLHVVTRETEFQLLLVSYCIKNKFYTITITEVQSNTRHTSYLNTISIWDFIRLNVSPQSWLSFYCKNIRSWYRSVNWNFTVFLRTNVWYFICYQMLHRMIKCNTWFKLFPPE